MSGKWWFVTCDLVALKDKAFTGRLRVSCLPLQPKIKTQTMDGCDCCKTDEDLFDGFLLPSFSKIQKPKFPKDMIVCGCSKMVYQRVYVLLDPRVLPQLPMTLAFQEPRHPVQHCLLFFSLDFKSMIPLLHDCVRLLQNDPQKVERSSFPESMTVATIRKRMKNTICPRVTLLLPPKSKKS
jgi:hypothetical protein